MSKYEGGCACGAVRFSTDAEPMMAGHCQCRHCQQLSGAGHSSFSAFPEAAIDMQGKVKYWDYIADSGNTASQGHCPICGSMVAGKTTGMAWWLSISRRLMILQRLCRKWYSSMVRPMLGTIWTLVFQDFPACRRCEPRGGVTNG